MSSLYVHIPFCKSICSYCDFAKVFYKKDWAFSYLKALKKELESYKNSRYDTIYIGGGTPTSLEDSLFEELLKSLSPLRKEKCEWSVESNPECLSDAKLELLKKYGVNRLSIGIQSSNASLLSLLERKHTFLEAENAIKMAKEKGFMNINVDLIYALQGESIDILDSDISSFLALEVPHISAYTLILEEGTKLKRDNYLPLSEDEEASQYEYLSQKLEENGYSHYEISNFAKKGYECQHNLVYWKDQEYDAIGLGASGYKDNIRYSNTKNLSSYLKGNCRASEEKIDFSSGLEYFFITNLRLQEGFSLVEFEERFTFSFEEKYRKEIDSLGKNGLLTIEKGHVKATKKGFLLLDRILLELI